MKYQDWVWAVHRYLRAKRFDLATDLANAYLVDVQSLILTSMVFFGVDRNEARHQAVAARERFPTDTGGTLILEELP